MGQLAPGPDLIGELRDRVAAVAAPARRAGTMPFGVGALDAVLAGGGLSRGALHEVAAAAPSLADDAASTLFSAGIAARCA